MDIKRTETVTRTIIKAVLAEIPVTNPLVINIQLIKVPTDKTPFLKAVTIKIQIGTTITHTIKHFMDKVDQLLRQTKEVFIKVLLVTVRIIRTGQAQQHNKEITNRIQRKTMKLFVT